MSGEVDNRGRIVPIVVAIGIVAVIVAAFLYFSTRTPAKTIIGRWRVEPATLCNAMYPNEIEFFDDHKYVASGLSLWGGGEYALVDDGRIRVDTHTGPSLYSLRMDGDRLTFTNDSGCSFSYRRAKKDHDRDD